MQWSTVELSLTRSQVALNSWWKTNNLFIQGGNPKELVKMWGSLSWGILLHIVSLSSGIKCYDCNKKDRFREMVRTILILLVDCTLYSVQTGWSSTNLKSAKEVVTLCETKQYPEGSTLLGVDPFFLWYASKSDLLGLDANIVDKWSNQNPIESICSLLLYLYVDVEYHHRVPVWNYVKKNVIWWPSLKLESFILNLRPILQLVQQNVVHFRDQWSWLFDNPGPLQPCPGPLEEYPTSRACRVVALSTGEVVQQVTLFFVVDKTI